MITTKMKKQLAIIITKQLLKLSIWTITQKWVNTNLPEFQNESVREIMSIWVN